MAFLERIFRKFSKKEFAMINEHILEEYKKNLGAFQSLANIAQNHLYTLLGRHHEEIHSISHRIKSLDSLQKKISQPDKTYHALDAVTDVLGIRVVTYFEDSIDDIAKEVERKFQIDFARSIDKRVLLDPTQFGYRSLHYICRMPGAKSPENEDLSHFYFEVQIRTLLQHAWAEIEHDLGYKSQESIPTYIRRRFSRIASLLEMADDEFLSIKKSLTQYETELQGRDPRTMQSVEIDKVSLDYFLHSDLPSSIDAEIAASLDLKLDDEIFFSDYLIKMLRHVGLSTIDKLDKELTLHKKTILRFVPYYFRFTEETWRFSSRDVGLIKRGYSLFFLAHITMLCSKASDIDKIGRLTNFYIELDSPLDTSTARNIAINLLAFYKESEVTINS